MKPEYDFSAARKNPYAKKLKRQVTINIDAIDYFKSMADRSGIPYQTLINLYLSDCVTNRRQLHTTWN